MPGHLIQRNEGQVVDLHNLPLVGLLEDLEVTEWVAQAVLLGGHVVRHSGQCGL